MSIETPTEPRAFIDCRCMCRKCEERTTDIYRMVGHRSNCGIEVLGLLRVGDKATDRDCLKCGVWHSCRFTRLATDDELPVDFEASE